MSALLCYYTFSNAAWLGWEAFASVEQSQLGSLKETSLDRFMNQKRGIIIEHNNDYLIIILTHIYSSWCIPNWGILEAPTSREKSAQ